MRLNVEQVWRVFTIRLQGMNACLTPVGQRKEFWVGGAAGWGEMETRKMENELLEVVIFLEVGKDGSTAFLVVITGALVGDTGTVPLS